jgi:hypothetical protein
MQPECLSQSRPCDREIYKQSPADCAGEEPSTRLTYLLTSGGARIDKLKFLGYEPRPAER